MLQNASSADYLRSDNINTHQLPFNEIFILSPKRFRFGAATFLC